MQRLQQPAWRFLHRSPTPQSRCCRSFSTVAHADPTGLVAWLRGSGGKADGVTVAVQPDELGYGLVATQVCTDSIAVHPG